MLMKTAIILVAIIGVTVSQYCHMCEVNACSLVAPGLSSCSKCAFGALLNVTTNVGNNQTDGEWEYKIGVCQPCQPGCSSCHFAVMPISMG